jgi:hypothetical protein
LKTEATFTPVMPPETYAGNGEREEDHLTTTVSAPTKPDLIGSSYPPARQQGRYRPRPWKNVFCRGRRGSEMIQALRPGSRAAAVRHR